MRTTYDFIAQNKRRTVLLVLLFPLVFALLVGVVFGVLYLLAADPTGMQASTPVNINGWQMSSNQFEIVSLAAGVIPVCWGLAVIWIIISYFAGDKFMLSSAQAIRIDRLDQPEIYRLVENLCITRGLPTPRIYIMDDDSLNAFATGRDPQHASIALTKGIVQKLDRVELEGVIAHELAHVENRDIRLMLITIAGISFFTVLGEWLLRMSVRGRNRKNDGAMLFMLLGMVCLLYGYLLAPLIRLAVSRQREYQADATAALTTRNPGALASALRKISSDCRVEVLDKSESMAAMCIANPLAKMGLFSSLSGLLATHPPIEKRIAVLMEMDSQRM